MTIPQPGPAQTPFGVEKPKSLRISLNRGKPIQKLHPKSVGWSGYGEAVFGGPTGNGKKAREGLVRACLSHRWRLESG